MRELGEGTILGQSLDEDLRSLQLPSLSRDSGPLAADRGYTTAGCHDWRYYYS